VATYKVIQDIEAEDKLVGPLSFRQFIYAIVCVFSLYLCFLTITKHVPFLLVIPLPVALFTGFFAFPFVQDQPTEVWALAKIRFIFKPRKRIWDQSGVKELVTITVPKKIERIYTNGLSQNEVKSRLSALADTIDSRGWAVKNVNVNLYSDAGALRQQADESDRLIGMSSMPQPVPDYEINAADDILDEQSNPVAQQFDQMINASSVSHRRELIHELNGIREQGADQANNKQWFQPPNTGSQDGTAIPTFTSAQTILPGGQKPVISTSASVTADEQEIADNFRLRNDLQQASNSHLHTIQPLSAASQTNNLINSTLVSQVVSQSDTVTRTTPSSSYPTVNQASPAAPDPAILSLANNNDLNVATLARQAEKAKQTGIMSSDEVVISLR
jgi:hypothetical protein